MNSIHFLDPRTNPPSDLVRCHQVHGCTVAVVDNEPLDTVSKIKADAIITKTRRPIGIQTADCLPVLFHSERAVGAAHAGWRGLQSGILLRTIDAFAELGVSARDLHVAIGPAIGQCCFEVDKNVIDAFERAWAHLWKNSKPWRTSQPESKKLARTQAPVSTNNLWLDLKVIAHMQLRAAGVLDKNVEDKGFCTYCGPNELASFRRSTHEGRSAARQWSWIQLN